jgi:hypothetical protein
MSDQFERDILARVENLEKLSSATAELVVGLVREEYAKNILCVEQEPLGVGDDFLRKVNADLLDKMANVLALKMRVDGRREMDGMTHEQITDGLKFTLKMAVDEHLSGLKEAVNDGG